MWILVLFKVYIVYVRMSWNIKEIIEAICTVQRWKKNGGNIFLDNHLFPWFVGKWTSGNCSTSQNLWFSFWDLLYSNATSIRHSVFPLSLLLLIQRKWSVNFTSIKTTHLHSYNNLYSGCPRKNVPDFGKVFLMLKYTDITQNTYVQSWTVMEIMAREKCGLLAGPRTVPVTWQVLSMFILEYGVWLRKVSSH